eukprot:7707309-Pyramimonas_sp.AAC.1
MWPDGRFRSHPVPVAALGQPEAFSCGAPPVHHVRPHSLRVHPGAPGAVARWRIVPEGVGNGHV